MKKAMRVTITLAFLICMLAGMLTVANAASDGSSMANATQISFGRTYSHNWTVYNDEQTYYMKFYVPARGVITISATKPTACSGARGEVWFTLYNANAQSVWGTETYYSVDDYASSYKFSVGLDKGTYYLAMDAGFYMSSGSVGTSYSVSYAENAYCEVESNDTSATATPLTINKNTVGYYGSDGAYDEPGDLEDWYSVVLQAGHTYRISISNYSMIADTTVLFDVYDPNGNALYLQNLDSQVDAYGMNYVNYTPEITGRYTLRVWNYCQAQYQYYLRISGSSTILDGWQKENSYWTYYVNNVKQTGWQKINGYYYYFNDSGFMQTGWVKSGNSWYYLKSNGIMATGWEKIYGSYYYFNRGGAMQTGWLKSGNVWYYLKSSGAMATGWEKVNGVYYYFRSSGAMQTGWVKSGNTWYYLDASGAMATGWEKINGTWYYFSKTGAMQTGTQVIDGVVYKFDANGAWIS